MSAFCAAVDWGTSSFRLWLLDEAGQVLAERRSGEGMSVARAGEGFAPVLERQLAEAGAPADLPVVACGMVGARQGWVEAPYAEVPASLQAIAEKALRVPDHRRPVFILPGVCQRGSGAGEGFDVMRGEETQIAGLGAADGRRLACLPGTHSKWIAVEGETITGFSTFVTGDLYAAIAGHTILQHSVDPKANDLVRRDFAAAFRSALERPGEASRLMFEIRARGLLDPAHPVDGASALSGLLIGLEFAGVRSLYGEFGRPVLLASGRLAAVYEAAFAEFGAVCDMADADAAVRRGLYAAARRILS
ncbi:2-dehydro-3-deoxygalactonokinase [Jiella sp. M17.18]|uniref:2-dehydro-3-deoxygalactonokinase n=1 Tax=Jiella sp. M17.18 TaxID=3234247 RepID=UPI0034DF8DD9